MSIETSNHRKDLNLDFVTRINSILGGAAGWLIVMYAVAYLVGFTFLQSYTHSLGIPWAISMYGPMDVIQAPSALTPIAAAIFLHLASNIEAFGKVKGKHAAILGAATIAATACHFGVVHLLPGFDSHWRLPAFALGIFTTLFTAIVVFRTTTEMYGAVKGSAFFAFLAVGFSAMVIPALASHWAAKDMERVRKGKPSVTLAADNAHQWKLVRAMPNSLLLMATLKDGEKVSFRLIPATDALEIESSD